MERWKVHVHNMYKCATSIGLETSLRDWNPAGKLFKLHAY